MKKVLLLMLLLLIMQVFAQSEFDEWLKNQNQNFKDWKSQQDKTFSEFLEKGWAMYHTEAAVERDSIPKPQEIPNPVGQSCPDLIVGDIISVEIDEEELKLPETSNILEDVQREQLMYAVSKGSETLRLSYWGLVFNLNYNANMKIAKIEKCNAEEIASFWGRISNTDYELILKDLQKMREKFKLNDWAFCQLIYQTGAEIYGEINMSNLFTWFILTKSGYDCKVGYNADDIYLLLATRNRIFGEPHLMLEDRDYYSIDLSNTAIKPLNIYTYDGSYPDADDLIDLNLTTSPYLEEVVVERQLSFSYKDSTWTIPIQQNKTLIDFLADYPATDLTVYFEAEISPLLRKSLIKGLTPILTERTEAEALNILLRFVQTAFKYQTDDQQFGEENSLFPDETIYYDYCDCEDRSILFSYLVKEFLGLEVIGLDYPGHIATAVQMNFDIEGDKITYNGSDYLVCDPTYINADIGVVMPQFLNVQPEIIQFR
ncbi:MAG: hypothetical protein K9M99_11200 [Candidatus Cloacimonetes bacterium]|nr:hypothetical protein [Candidatus Cloacimonadota bacterium]